MLTYQDLLAVPDNDRARAEFVRKTISEHKQSPLYKTARIADDYDRCRNTTTMQYQKTVTDLTGRAYVDPVATVHRSTSNFFNIFTTQINQYLLGNGVTWKGQAKDRLGADFDARLQQAGKAALCGGVAFGFFNLDHMEVFKVLEFAPLYDEENGALAAGVRWWQIDESKPMRATLYELDGLTEYLWSNDKTLTISDNWTRIDDGVYMQPRRAYILHEQGTEADGTKVYAGENYESFPIVPLWGNPRHQSELVGMREKIDAYDFILNGWEDDLDNAQIYWILHGAGGMDDPDLLQFLDRLRTVKAAAPAEGQDVQPVEVNIPYEARERLLDRMEKQLYKDAMAFNPEDVKSGSTVTAQIEAAYEPLDLKTNDFEYCVLDFISGILKVAGIEDKATFTRSKLSNVTELIQSIVLAASHLSGEYVTRKILTLLGDGDKADEVLRQVDAEDAERLGSIEDVTANA